MTTRWLRNELDHYGILPANQLALKRGLWGCTEAHAIDRTIVEDALELGEMLSIAWIDFSKAFDSISHEYLLWVLKAAGVSDDLRDIIEGLMDSWSLVYEGFAGGKRVRSTPLKIRNGVLQGDTLSPLLFCVCIAVISHYLNANLDPYVTSVGNDGDPERILRWNHTYFVDDLVMYSKDSAALQQAVDGVARIGRYFGVQLNAEKSAIYHIRPSSRDGQPVLVRPETPEQRLPVLEKNSFYPYLGVKASEMTDFIGMWKSGADVVLTKARTIWSSVLTFRQKVTAFNAVCLPKMKYIVGNEIYGGVSFSVLREYASDLDQSVKNLLTELHARHRCSSVGRLYLSPREGGLGLGSFKQGMYEALVYAYCYVAIRKSLKPCWYVMSYLTETKRTLQKDILNILRDCRIEMVIGEDDTGNLLLDERAFSHPTKAARYISAKVNDAMQAQYRDSFLGCVWASRAYRLEFIHARNSSLWLKKGLLSSIAVNNVLAAQESQLYVAGHVLHRGSSKNQRCRLNCHGPGEHSERETPQHILTGCAHWRHSLMVDRHDGVARNLYNAMCRKLGLETRHYRQKIEGVRETGPYILYWNHPLITTRKVRHNRPDIVLVNKIEKTTVIIEISVSWFMCLDSQEKRKYAKYALNSDLEETHPLENGRFPPGPNLASEWGKDQNHKTTVVPIVIGATGEVSRNHFGYLRGVGLFTNKECEDIIERMERSAVLGSTRIIKAHFGIKPRDEARPTTS
jgi:hypothetical protein